MFRRAAFAFVALLATGAPAAAQPANVEAGRAIAERWCAQCHVTSAAQARGISGVPSFAAIARDPQWNETNIWDAISRPRHPAMPGILLSRDELRALLAFIRTQAP